MRVIAKMVYELGGLATLMRVCDEVVEVGFGIILLLQQSY